MKYSIAFEGDYYEDWEELQDLVKHRDWRGKLHNIYEMARTQLKHGDRSQDEDVLEQIKTEAWME